MRACIAVLFARAHAHMRLPCHTRMAYAYLHTIGAFDWCAVGNAIYNNIQSIFYIICAFKIFVLLFLISFDFNEL